MFVIWPFRSTCASTMMAAWARASTASAGYRGSTRWMSLGATTSPPIRTTLAGGGGAAGRPPTTPPTTPPGTPPSTPPGTPPSMPRSRLCVSTSSWSGTSMGATKAVGGGDAWGVAVTRAGRGPGAGGGGGGGGGGTSRGITKKARTASPTSGSAGSNSSRGTRIKPVTSSACATSESVTVERRRRAASSGSVRSRNSKRGAESCDRPRAGVEAVAGGNAGAALISATSGVLENNKRATRHGTTLATTRAGGRYGELHVAGPSRACLAQDPGGRLQRLPRSSRRRDVRAEPAELRADDPPSSRHRGRARHRQPSHGALLRGLRARDLRSLLEPEPGWRVHAARARRVRAPRLLAARRRRDPVGTRQGRLTSKPEILACSRTPQRVPCGASLLPDIRAAG